VKKYYTKVVEALQRFAAFISETKAELKKVTWPDNKEVYNTTIVVILTSFFFGLYLFLVDLGLQYGIHYLTQWIRG